MTHGSLFSGIGGFELAAEWMGWDNIFHCEINPFGQKILKYYWPKSISYEDIKKTDFTIHRGGIDILTGGFPCQPYSIAGKRKGKEDERHLWPEMLRAIREIKPRWIVGENVFGIVNWNGGLVFEEVQSDLEAEGYEVQAYVLPACSKDAPHRRDRVWFVGYCNIVGRQEHKFSARGKMPENNNDRERIATNITNTRDESLRKQEIYPNKSDVTSHTESGRKRRLSDEGQKGGPRKGDQSFGGIPGISYDATNPQCSGRGQNNEQYPSKESKYVIPSWERFPTQSAVCSRDDGISDRLDFITFPKWRAESIKGYGNAIVPQIVFEIFKSIEQYQLK